jgi:hypothetical protein
VGLQSTSPLSPTLLSARPWPDSAAPSPSGVGPDSVQEWQRDYVIRRRDLVVSFDAASQRESEEIARAGDSNRHKADSSRHKADSSRQTADGEALVRFSQPHPREPSLSWPHDLLLASIEHGGQDRLAHSPTILTLYEHHPDTALTPS